MVETLLIQLNISVFTLEVLTQLVAVVRVLAECRAIDTSVSGRLK